VTYDGSHPARPARAVADAPLAALADGDALAKGWLLTLIAGAPLAHAGSVPTADMARDAPALCAAMVAALAADADLDRLAPGGDLHGHAARAGSMTGAHDAAAVIGSLAALRASLWNAVSGELRDGDPELVSALAARLARVCDVVAGAVFADDVAAETAAPAAPSPVVPAESEASRVEPLVAAPEPPAAEPAAEEQPLAPRLAAVPALGSVPADVFPTVSAGQPPASAEEESWATAVVGRLSRLLAERGSCAVLAVDIDDAERLLAADVRGEVAAMIERAEQAIHDTLRPADAGVRERDGRVWVVAADTSLDVARELAKRIVTAVAEAGELHGAPLRTSIGIATSPPDGDDAASLIAHADEGVYAARAAGVSLA
jgi:GGDEF domain-containing protein